MVLHEGVDATPQAELVEDLLSIVTVFGCRVNGRRKYNRAKEGRRPDEVQEANGQLSEESEAVL